MRFLFTNGKEKMLYIVMKELFLCNKDMLVNSNKLFFLCFIFFLTNQKELYLFSIIVRIIFIEVIFY
jgi:hypothetical protein